MPVIRTALEDSSSPYYLQKVDHPGVLLVSNLLPGSNYNTWSRSMIVALTTKNKIGFIYNSIDQPRSEDLLYGSWRRCNSMVISWILNSVTRDIADSLMYMPTAREIWIDLHDIFHESNAPRVYQIKKFLNGLQQGSMDISLYYTKERIFLWDELGDYQPTSVCNCGSMKEWITYQNQGTVTRTDLAFAVNKLSQYVSKPRLPHMEAALNILRYVKGNIGQGLFYGSNSDLRLKFFSDADWGAFLDT
ncbi:hypothetical protein F511_21401 [Dorcoceras hygrometricum]|uniref:Retrotransposon Copia-like N-terminal domain-containing protein n=1 Tax=Dorcoceras hygrometricum TaxID=472368 RepID=A0A2Z7CNL8_9LAMI|nr:hypothetical protein F511_21401 [Dorcoceras hygrometricum]